MVWLLGSILVLIALYENCWEKTWKESKGLYRSALPNGFMALMKAEQNNTGFTIQDCMEDPLLSRSAVQEAAEMPVKHSGMEVERLYQFMMSTSLDEGALKSEKNRTLGNPFFSYAVENLEFHVHDRGLICYSCTKELMEFLEKEVDAEYSTDHSAMEVWLG